MYELETIAVFLISIIATGYLTKRFITRFHQGGYVVKDMYKPERPQIPTMGGVAMLGGIMVSLVAAELLIKNNDYLEKLLLFYFVIFVYGIFGILDDLIKVKSHFKKVYILYFLALPIALLNVGTDINLSPLIILHIGWLKPFIIAPLYVMVVANLVNMHSGYNGLSSGLSIILLFFICLKVFLTDPISGLNLTYIMPVLGSLLAFYYFDRYPSRILWGNVGSLAVGGAIGSYLILSNVEIFGVVILIPHILDFLLFCYTKIIRKEFIKFGRVRADDTIEAPNPYKLKFFFPYFFRLTEKQNVFLLYCLTFIFGIAAIFLVH